MAQLPHPRLPLDFRDRDGSLKSDSGQKIEVSKAGRQKIEVSRADAGGHSTHLAGVPAAPAAAPTAQVRGSGPQVAAVVPLVGKSRAIPRGHSKNPAGVPTAPAAAPTPQVRGSGPREASAGVPAAPAAASAPQMRSNGRLSPLQVAAVVPLVGKMAQRTCQRAL